LLTAAAHYRLSNYRYRSINVVIVSVIIAVDESRRPRRCRKGAWHVTSRDEQADHVIGHPRPPTSPHHSMCCFCSVCTLHHHRLHG